MKAEGTEKVVRAAGGVVWRRAAGGQGEIEVLLVHRPKYDDWTFPKGKANGDEDDEGTALREVEEETGLRCVLGEELTTVSYIDRLDRPKVVRYWAMTPVDGRFEPSDEVDEVRWIPEPAAEDLLSYSRDREVLEAFARRL
jgi:8-oxo-dGTP diphosphatase